MPVGTSAAPFGGTLRFNVPAAATAVADETTLGTFPFDATVTAVRFIAEAAITGANTNTRNYRLRNRGQAGVGAVVVASRQMNSGVNAVAFDGEALTLSVTAADLDLTAGDTLTWESLVVGTGLADPGGAVEIDFSRR